MKRAKILIRLLRLDGLRLIRAFACLMPRWPEDKISYMHISSSMLRLSGFLFIYLSLVVRKPAFCICENKDAEQLRGNREADQRLCFFFARIVQSLYFQNPKFQASNHLLYMYSQVCVGPGRKPRRPFFSQRGSFHFSFPAYQSAFAIYGWKPTYNSATGVAIFPDNAVKLNLGTDYSPTTGQFTCRYAGVYVFVLNLYRWKKDGSRVMCFIRINGRDIAYANAPAYSEYGWNGGSGSTVVHLDQGDAVDAGTCDGGDNVSGSMSFMGFLLQAD